ncbi:hypothetical protein [Faecalibacterium sp. An77]|uniref:hypothetical protein n=1 Tax=Faecalibacterium sp. An77 TaxID=1965655 RepID=UPI0011869D42|nr:hypothetical protein [Faecalibacterium sp. An77]
MNEKEVRQRLSIKLVAVKVVGAGDCVENSDFPFPDRGFAFPPDCEGFVDSWWNRGWRPGFSQALWKRKVEC